MHGRALALDIGDRRVGVAVSDPTGTIARPLTTIERASRQEDFAAVARLVAAHEAVLIVVGRPLSLDGSEGPQARKVTRYAEALSRQVQVPVVYYDERYSTSEASEIMRARRPLARQSGQPGGVLDAIAAAVILQRYLDNQAGVLNLDTPDKE